MEVVDAKEMARLERLAIEKDPKLNDQFMQNASKNMASALEHLANKHHLPKKITLVAGKGNNGGDAFCTALHLLEKGFEVQAYWLSLPDQASDLCQKYAKALKEKISFFHLVQSEEDLHLPSDGFLLDGLLGTGFEGSLDSTLKEVIKKMNTSKALKVALDIPSGLSGNTGQCDPVAFEADYTLFLGLAKRGFFIEEGWKHVGRLIHCSFGLQKEYLEKARGVYTLVRQEEIKTYFPPIVRTRHKYQAGYVVGICGSESMQGASILSGMAALRSGAGMVKLIHLNEKLPSFSSYPELIHLHFSSKEIKPILEVIEKATCVYIGPGLGASKTMQTFLGQLLPHIQKPCLLDADALSLMALNKWKYPKDTLITPHQGEMQRLLQKSFEETELLHEACEKYVQHSGVTLLLKGGPSFIFQKNKKPVVMPRGDPGMATAGSGDVLTGILAGLWSQKEMSVEKVVKLGTYLHGLVGEYAAKKKSSYSLTASDLLKYLHHAFNQELFDELY